jgi:hypothetical protein
VVQASDHDLVAGAQQPADDTAELEGQCGHVGAEDDLIRGSCVQEIRHRLVGGREHGDRLLAGPERAMGVGVAACQIAAHSVDHGLRHLGAAGAVEVDGWMARIHQGKGRKLRAKG